MNFYTQNTSNENSVESSDEVNDNNLNLSSEAVPDAVNTNLPTDTTPVVVNAMETQLDADSEATSDLPSSPVQQVYPLDAPPAMEMSSSTAQRANSFASSEDLTVTTVPYGWTFTGDITSENNLALSCVVIGNIATTNPWNSVTMSTTSRSKGTITGRDVRLSGEHEGKIDASGGGVLLEKTSKIDGEIVYTRIQVDGGKHFITLEHVDE
jgi:cytoskeletal protein CcmA (bactofilin family)